MDDLIENQDANGRPMRFPVQRTVLITGASRGLGRALALEYAAPGVNLVLVGRCEPPLLLTASDCRRLGATVYPCVADVADFAALKTALGKLLSSIPFDIVIANAGCSTQCEPGKPVERFHEAEQVIKTNVLGVFNTISLAVPGMVERGSGNIVLVGSAGGLFGVAHKPSYSSSKAWVHTYAQALRESLRTRNVAVTLVIPGFIATDLVKANLYHMPLLVYPEAAAKKIVEGTSQRRHTIVFPLWVYAASMAVRLLPPKVRTLLIAWSQTKLLRADRFRRAGDEKVR